MNHREKLAADAREFDAFLNMVPARFLMTEEALHSLPKEDSRFDPRKVTSTAQRVVMAAGSMKKKSGKRGDQLTQGALRSRLHDRIDQLKEKRKDEQRKEADVQKASRATERAGETLEIGNITVREKRADLTAVEMQGNAPGSKKRKMQQQLKDAEGERAKLQKLSGSERSKAVQEIEMQKALARASGEKVHDKTGKLRRAIKEMDKKKGISKHKWDERKNAEFKTRMDKHESRKEHLKGRSTRGKDKMQNRHDRLNPPEKEEKASERAGKKDKKAGKTTERAGFEGKKGYLNSK